jgi:hypothetical protein
MTQATATQAVPKLSTDENGSFTGLFQLPGGIFRTGDRTIRIDNRATDSTPDTSTTFSQGVFTASSIATKSTSLNFGGTIQAAAKSTVFTATQQALNQLISSVSFTIDPIAQTFIIDQATYTNGAFINSIKVYFRTKPSGASSVPVRLFITDTLNGYPNGQVLDGSLVTKTAQEINISDNPQYLDSSTYTEFVFESPVYIRSGNLYAFVLQTTTPDYTVWTAAQNSIAVASSVKNLPSDQLPTVITKIGGSPYIGALFESQNGITWTADQTKNLMFVIDNCVFNTAVQPSVQYVVPKKIPLRKKMANDLEYISNANTASNIDGTLYAEDVVVDAFNVTTLDFKPTNTDLTYTYTSTLYSDYSVDATKNIQPGKFATTMEDHIYLDDGKGSRVLDANSNNSFVVTATLSSNDKYVSPILSDDGLSVYAIKYNITNMDIANTDVLVTSGNTANITAVYTSTPPAVTISAPTAVGGQQAFATANVVSNGSGGYIVDKINITTEGSGYIITPSVTIAGNANSYSATAIVTGETSSDGGNGLSRYITKKVVLTPGNDSGDIRVYYTAYKPVGSSILVYYKIQSRNDTEKFEDQNWQIMTETDGVNSFSLSRDDLREFVSAPGTNNIPANKISYTSTSGLTYDQFSQFTIKIVLATSDSTRTPILHDLRVLALPSGA